MADTSPMLPDGPILAALNTGSRLDLLVALRREVAETIDRGPAARDLAALTIRLMDLDAEVRALESSDDPVAAAQSAAPEPWTP